jgi:hypothetical protein
MDSDTIPFMIVESPLAVTDINILLKATHRNGHHFQKSEASGGKSVLHLPAQIVFEPVGITKKPLQKRLSLL